LLAFDGRKIFAVLAARRKFFCPVAKWFSRKRSDNP